MKILVIDRETAYAQQLAGEFTRQGHEPAVSGDANEAMARIQREAFDLVVADAKACGDGGSRLLRQAKAGPSPETEVVLMSDNGSIRAAVEAVKGGAFDFVAKPLTSAEIAAMIARLHRRREHVAREDRRQSSDEAEHATGSRPTSAEIDQYVIGASEELARVKKMIKVSARTDANVLIYGETGTGKDLIASVIHRLSHRSESPLVKVGCATLPASLIESELYGHEEGSFTGADQFRKGRFELADGGTVYLDDVDDIPIEQQAKLLRAIEEKVFERVGGTKPIRANVRVVASSKKNLLGRIAEGTFRSDLYYRLDVLRIRIPPLRERRRDIPALTEHLLERIAGDEPYWIEPQAVVLLAQHNWPGNVRELYHTLERTYLIGGGRVTADLIEAEMCCFVGLDPSSALTPRSSPKGFQAVMHQAEQQLLLSALEACGGNKTAAASSLGMKPSTFRDKLAKHGI
jgi:DNA-binding NtrC family response regulator